MFTWKNRAGVKWDLTLVGEVEPGTLMFEVGENCPYFNKSGYTTANLYFNIDSTEDVKIEGPGRESYKKLGRGPDSTTTTSSSTSTSTTFMASTSAPSTDTGVTTNSDTSPVTSKVPPPSASTQTVLLSGILLIIMLIVAAVFITNKRSKKQKEQKEKREEVVDENPVYQQYELVGENYKRQYSTHEVVDCNDYYG